MPGRHRIIGEVVINVFEGKLEPLGEAKGIGEGVGSIAKESFHFGCALQMTLRIFRQARARGVKVDVFADAGKHVEHFTSARGGMLHPIGREKGQPKMFCKVDQAAIDSFFSPNEMALKFDVDILLA
jgi:hypothetical protein